LAAKRKELQGTTSNIIRIQAVGGWQDIGVEEKMSDMFWQYGFSGYGYGKNNDDGFTIYVKE
jgi:mannan endo-1,4-beta-mannosidase